MRRAPVIALGIIAACLAADDADQAAGRAELDALETKIAEVRALLAADDVALDAKQRESFDLFAGGVEQHIRAYEPYRDPLPQTVTEFPAWYLQTLKERTGWGPLEPTPAWQQRWQDTRRAEHAIYHRYEALRVSLRRLERLRDRLRRQLGLED